ncbi:MAG: cation diffusion facilitator family transporter [Betaproteobacteria bacterium]|nr:cation diffusion facilitator family transporter [Betaproteobacteria bacterium]
MLAGFFTGRFLFGQTASRGLYGGRPLVFERANSRRRVRAFAVVEALAGWRGGSLALLADAGHMVTDGAALGLALLAARIAARPPSARHSYGMGRIELLAALTNALAMLAVVFGIGVEAWSRFRSPHAIEGALVGAVAAVGLGVNLLVAWMLSHGQQNINVRGAFLHVLGDVLGSVAAMIAGIVVWATGWTPIDPLLSLPDVI